MLSRDEKKIIKKGLAVSWLIWGSGMVAVLVVLVVCQIMVNTYQASIGIDLPMSLVKYILFALSVITFLLIPFLKKYLLDNPGKGFANTSDDQADLKEFSPPFLVRYLIIIVITGVLSESIALYGAVLFLLGAGMQTVYIFVALSALALFVSMPDREQIETLARVMRTDKHANG